MNERSDKSGIERDTGKQGTLPRHVLGLASLLATPLILFISSSNNLYLTNQNELHNQLEVLLPFVGAFLIMFGTGIAFYALSRFRPFSYLLRAYYVTGPFFLIFLFVQKMPIGYHIFYWIFDTPAGVGVLFASFAAIVHYVAPRFDLPAAVKPLALFSLLLVILESYTFHTKLAPPRTSMTFSAVDTGGEAANDLPNIYHIILDGYQSDIFSMTLSPELSSALTGFVYFPNTVAVHNSTGMSLSSIFTGKEFASNLSEADFMRLAYNSEESFINALKKGGYTTIGYVPFGFTKQRFFDHFITHRKNVKNEKLLELNKATFKRLWLYANAPLLLTRWLLGVEWFIQYNDGGDLKLMRNERLLAYSRPVASHLSFLNILEQEPHLPESGRYTLVHLFIPHSPDILRSDCSYGEPGTMTGPIEQARCATKLLLDFVDLLKSLGRFENSLIFAHADHGNFWRLTDGRLVPSDTISLRSMLLIKPIGNSEAFAVSEVNVTLLDVAPSLLAGVGLTPDVGLEGSVLREVVDRTRVEAGNK